MSIPQYIYFCFFILIVLMEGYKIYNTNKTRIIVWIQSVFSAAIIWYGFKKLP